MQPYLEFRMEQPWRTAARGWGELSDDDDGGDDDFEWQAGTLCK